MGGAYLRARLEGPIPPVKLAPDLLRFPGAASESLAQPIVAVLSDLGADGRREIERDPRFLAVREADEISSNVSVRVLGLVVRSGILVTAELISQFPNLRFVIRAGSGVDNIDQRALSARGVKLIRKPDLAAESVAELAAVSLLGLCRRLHQSMALLFRGVWAKNWLIGDDVSRFFVGIWGAGPVGRACYERFRGMCERVAFAAWPSVPAGLEVASADALMCQADAHIVCLPLRMNTVNKFDAGFFERSSDKRPYLINVARLGLMDLGAAFGALKSNRLRGFAVDGIDQCDMMRLESVLGGEGGTGYNFLVSQHLGAQRVDVHREMIRWLIAEVDHWVSPHA